MVYRLVPVDTLTGVPIINHVRPESGRATPSITSVGTGDFTIPLRDARRPLGHLAERLGKGWATTYVLEWVDGSGAFTRAGTPVYAGLVTGRRFNEATGMLTVRTKEAAAILAFRLLFAVGQYAHGTRIMRGATLGDIIRESYRLAIGGGQHRWALPIDMPGYSPGPLERIYWRYGFQSAQQWLEQLAAEDNAPDHYMRPVWVGGRLRWRLEIGSPRIQGRVVRLPVAAGGSRPKSSVVDLEVETEFQYQRTGVFTIGQGSEEDMRWSEAGGADVAIDPAVPFLDATQSFKQVDDIGQLKSLSTATLAMSTGGVEQWSSGVQAEGRVSPLDVQAGGTALLDHPGSELVTAGRRRHMVLQATYTIGSTRVGVESQEF